MKTLRTLDEFQPLSEAEQQIVDEIDSGEFIILGDGTLPAEDAGEARQVRGRFVRYLALGGCDACKTHEKGLQISGALIKDVLDLGGCDLGRDLALSNCRILQTPVFRSASLNNLFLSGSHLYHGLQADGLEAKGGVFLKDVKAEGMVRLLGARLGRNLQCVGANFQGARDEEGNVASYAFSADLLDATGSVFLNDVKAEGGVRLSGAKLGGNIFCIGASFQGVRDGKGNVASYAFLADGLEAKGGVFLKDVKAEGGVRLPGAKLGGNLECGGASFRGKPTAISLQNSVVRGTFFWRKGTSCNGRLDLRAANVSVLSDAADCWPDQGNLYLDRFRYGAIVDAPVDAKSRIWWLALQVGDFIPQPYEQLAKVLREMGHGEDARAVLIEKDKLQRKARRKDKTFLGKWWLAFWDKLLAITVRYGHRPLFAFAWLLGFWLLGAVVFANAASQGAFKPASPRVLLSEEWRDCAEGSPSQMACFLDRVPSYPQFNALIYSADTLLPIVDLEMQNSWIPDESQGMIGVGARWCLWLQIIVGWALSLLAVAGFSGLVKSD